MSSKLHVKLFQGLSGYTVLLESWKKVLLQLEEMHFVQHPAWHFAIQKWLLPDQLSYVLIEDDREPLGIIPLIVQKQLHGGHEIISPRHDHISLSDWICTHALNTGDVIDLLPEIIRSLKVKNWDTFVFDSFYEVIPIRQIHSRMQGTGVESTNRLLSTSASYKESAWFDCSLGKNPVSSKMLRNLNRLKLQAEQQGEVIVRYVRQQNDLNEAFDQFLSIESSGWKGQEGSGSAIQLDRNLRGFYHELLNANKAGFEAGINLLTIDGESIAAHFVVKVGQRVSILKTAYCEKYSHFSPGSILLSEFIKASVEDKDIKQVSLVTNPEWAARWHPKTIPVYRNCFYNNTTAGKAIRHLDGLKTLAKTTYKDYLKH